MIIKTKQAYRWHRQRELDGGNFTEMIMMTIMMMMMNGIVIVSRYSTFMLSYKLENCTVSFCLSTLDNCQSIILYTYITSNTCELRCSLSCWSLEILSRNSWLSSKDEPSSKDIDGLRQEMVPGSTWKII